MKKHVLFFFFLTTNLFGFSQCHEIFITVSGTGSGVQNDPAGLDSAMLIAVPGDVLKLDTGTYVLNNSLQLKDSITICFI